MDEPVVEVNAPADDVGDAAVEAVAESPAAAVATAEGVASNPAAPEPVPAAADLAPRVAELESQLASVTSERDAALAQATTAQALVAPLQTELCQLQQRLANYELGAALAENNLPPQAGPLVKQLYVAAMAQCDWKRSVGDWLRESIADPESPAASLVLMRPQAVQSDPRNGAGPVNGSGSAPGLRAFPSFGSY